MFDCFIHQIALYSRGSHDNFIRYFCICHLQNLSANSMLNFSSLVITVSRTGSRHTSIVYETALWSTL